MGMWSEVIEVGLAYESIRRCLTCYRRVGWAGIWHSMDSVWGGCARRMFQVEVQGGCMLYNETSSIIKFSTFRERLAMFFEKSYKTSKIYYLNPEMGFLAFCFNVK